MSVCLVTADGEELQDMQDEHQRQILVGNKVVNSEALIDHLGVQRTFFIFVS